MTVSAQSELQISVSRDDDGDCSVDVTMVTDGFRGTGHAWLNVSDIVGFARSTAALASTSKGEAVLRGGYFSEGASPHFTINVSVRPHGSRGHVLVVAELATGPLNLDAQIFAVSRMSGGLIAEPAALARFAASLIEIPKGTSREAVVGGERAA